MVSRVDLTRAMWTIPIPVKWFEIKDVDGGFTIEVNLDGHTFKSVVITEFPILEQELVTLSKSGNNWFFII